MKQLLFIGGTAFFGKQALKKLIISGDYHITVLTRGNICPEEFKKHVKFICCDRSDRQALKATLKGQHFDIVVDNIARTASDVRNVLDIFRGRIEHYLLCSSGAVYPRFLPHEWSEEEAVFELITGQREYANNKREAESTLVSYRDVPYTIYRPTVVEGPEDSTKRISYFIEKIDKQKPFDIPAEVLFKHVYSGDVANAIVALVALGPTNKAYNICGDDKITLEEYCFKIAEILGRAPCHRLVPVENFLALDHGNFPSSYDRTLILSNALLKSTIPFHPTSINFWLPITVRWGVYI